MLFFYKAGIRVPSAAPDTVPTGHTKEESCITRTWKRARHISPVCLDLSVFGLLSKKPDLKLHTHLQTKQS